jgi:hypothetical protein
MTIGRIETNLSTCKPAVAIPKQIESTKNEIIKSLISPFEVSNITLNIFFMYKIFFFGNKMKSKIISMAWQKWAMAKKRKLG